MGERWKPRYLSDGFKRILEQNGLRRIRFHDLRHTCASLLLANNVPMKKIQEWLGHSDFSTTANIYAHLDYQSKISSAEAMLTGLGMSWRTTFFSPKQWKNPDKTKFVRISFIWRRVRDSNPRRFDPHSISSAAPSTTRTTLHEMGIPHQDTHLL